MEFHLRARSEDTLKPVYQFDGDEVVEAESYEQCMANGYMSTLSFVKGGAEALGLDLDNETVERWKRVCNAAYLIDDFLDTAPDIQTACNMYEASMARVFEATNEQLLNDSSLPPGTDKRLQPAIVLLKNSVGTLSEGRVAQLKNAAATINDIARQKQSCDDPAQYVSFLKREAYYTSILITESASEEVRRQDAYPEFIRWWQHTMALAILGDTAIDLKKDYEQGVTKVAPTVRNIAKIALHGYLPAHAMIHTVPQRRATISSLIERSKFYRT